MLLSVYHGPGAIPTPENEKRGCCTLRKKLGDAGKYICTVRKVGYKLTDEEEAGEE